MAATTVDTVSAKPGLTATAAAPLGSRAVDELLAGTGYVIEVERWPDEHPAGLCPEDDTDFRDAAADGLLACYEVTLATASGAELTRTALWSEPGVVCGPYTSCSALGGGLAEELAGVLARALTDR